MTRFIYSLSFVALLSTIAAAQEASLSVTNSGNVPVILNWVDFNGQEQTYQTIQPKQRADQQTYVGHKWVIRVADTKEYLSEVTMSSIAQGIGVAKMVRNRPIDNPPINPINPPDISQLPPLNAAVLQHARSQMGRLVGNGQCTELAQHALRMAGANANPGGGYPFYTWGTQFMNMSELRPGDIIQLANASFMKVTSAGWSSQSAAAHTAVVTSVEGSKIKVLEQNVSGSPVQAGEYDMSTMQQGTVNFFHPAPASNFGVPFTR